MRYRHRSRQSCARHRARDRRTVTRNEFGVLTSTRSTEKEVYLSLEIDAGHWTRISEGEGRALPGEQAQQPDGLVRQRGAADVAGELAGGYGLVVLKTEAERRAELAERALREERDKVRFLTELLHGKAAA